MPGLKQKLLSPITETPALVQVPHLPSLDGLRGLSIIIVLIYHILLANGYSRFNGMFGVNVFFVISGFIITTLLMKEKVKGQGISLGKFYARRSLKILPLAFFYLGITALLNSYFHLVTGADILSAALFIKNTNVIPTHWDVATGHFWSLSVEEQFYLLFPFILKKNTNVYLTVLVALIVFIPIVLTTEHTYSTGGIAIVLDFARYITPILTGALLAMLVFKKVIVKKLYPNSLITNFLVLLAAYAIYSGTGILSGLYYKNFTSSALIAALIVNNLFVSEDLFFRMLNSKPLVMVGLASYSIYVWQQLFLLWHPWQYLFAFSGSIWFNIPALLVVSFCSYYFIERRLAKLKGRFR